MKNEIEGLFPIIAAIFVLFRAMLDQKYHYYFYWGIDFSWNI
ncbi:MAG: hypothetical protein PHY30_00700 [Candidatus Pacebacteria bacterium]|nr:hypothetical protein [Candidatus Paceibacterota bacterium]